MVVISNFLTPQEGIRHEEPNTTLYVNEREVGKGTIYITESSLSWINNSTRQGFSLDYPSISLHAISRDEQVHARQCLYVMVDAKIEFPDSQNASNENNSANNENNDNEDDSDPEITEMRFAPENTASLEAMFTAMNECQALHPDPQDSFSEEDIYEDAAEEDYADDAADAPYILPEGDMNLVFQNMDLEGRHQNQCDLLTINLTDHIVSHNGTENGDNMDIEAGQFEDAEEDP